MPLWQILGVMLFGPVVACGGRHPGAAPVLTIASTTSTHNSGLFEHLLPLFTEATGLETRVIAVGTGHALRLGERGDADVLIVHHRPSEEAFVAAGHGTERVPFMYNDFVILGPRSDPARLRGQTDIGKALTTWLAGRGVFLSRGDESGTHKKEMDLWRAAGVEPTQAGRARYRSVGQGMGATITMAVALEAYTLSDRSTWLAHGSRGTHDIVVEADPRLRNPYAVIPVSPTRHPHLQAEAARALRDWLISPAGQAAIASFRLAGEQAFFPHTEDAGGGARD